MAKDNKKDAPGQEEQKDAKDCSSEQLKDAMIAAYRAKDEAQVKLSQAQKTINLCNIELQRRSLGNGEMIASK